MSMITCDGCFCPGALASFIYLLIKSSALSLTRTASLSAPFPFFQPFELANRSTDDFFCICFCSSSTSTNSTPRHSASIFLLTFNVEASFTSPNPKPEFVGRTTTSMALLTPFSFAPNLPLNPNFCRSFKPMPFVCFSHVPMSPSGAEVGFSMVHKFW